ncbi:MAG: sporulation protein YabP [Peptococcaceae bacterium]|nr:sporulation protein YabP [Peptococcaceae bacterium]
MKEISSQRSTLKSAEGHTLTMIGRHSLKVTGVGSVTSFDEKEIHLETVEGAFVIVGEDLGIKNLNLEQAQLDIQGTIHVLSYLDGSARARRKKIWEKLFR